MEWNGVIDEIGMMTCDDYDQYGHYAEYEAVPTLPLRERIVEQLDTYIESDDSYIDTYLRRYDDGLTRLFVTVNEDFTEDGYFIEQEIELPVYVLEDLDDIEL